MWEFEVSTPAVKNITKVLQDLGGVCQRCILRFAGIKNSKAHTYLVNPPAKNGSRDEEGMEGDGPPAKKTKLEPCRVCLGLLQDDFMNCLLKKVGDDIRDSGYDSDHYSIALSLPISMALRNHSLSIYLQEHAEDHFDEDDIVPVKQVWKWFYPNKVEQQIGKKCVTGDNCDFYVELEVMYEQEEAENAAILKMCEEEFTMRAKKQNKYHMGLITRQGMEKSLGTVPDKKFRQHYPVPPAIPTSNITGKVNMTHNSSYIAGRYNKYSRELPQTPWFVDGERRMGTSVEELIVEEIKSAFKFDNAIFCSSGREDVDVRTLGRGRPFVFEITNPRKTKFTHRELKEIQSKINEKTKDVRVRDLQPVPKSGTKILKEGEDQKRKTYTALCISPTPIEASRLEMLETVRDLVLAQRTPIRVLHRRPNAVRKRTVFAMKAEPLDEKRFKLRLDSQAGTYIKEFVHGDLNRTVPNLRQLLECDVDIMALDVEEIDLDWPPELDHAKGDELLKV